MTTRKDGAIEIIDEQSFEGCVFRVARFKQGACSESLWCRVELIPAGGYGISFYHRHSKADALHARNPLQAIPSHLTDLAIIALQKLEAMQEQRLSKFTSIPF